MYQRFKNIFLENRTPRQMFFKNVFWLSTSNILNRFIRFILVVYAARILGTEDYGVFSYAVGVAALFSILNDMGIDSLITKETANDHTLLKKYLSSALATKLFLTTINILLIIFVAPLFVNIKESISLIPIAALLVGFDGLRDLGFAIARAWQKMELEALIEFITNVSITLLGIMALIWKPDAGMFLLGYTLGLGIGTVSTWLILKKQLTTFWSRVDFATIKIIFSNAIPLSLAGLLGSIMLNTDMVILGYFITTNDLGLYAAAQRSVMILYAIPAILGTAIFPNIARSARENKERLQIILQKSLIASFLISFPLFLGGILLAKDIIYFLFGKAYLAAVPIFITILFTIIIVFLQILLTDGIFALNRQKVFIKFLIIGSFGNIILDLVFIPFYGALGSAIATVIIGVIITILMWKEITLEIVLHTRVQKIIFAAFFMSIIVLLGKFIGLPLFLNIIISSGVYFFILSLLHESTFDDLIVSLRQFREKVS